MYIGLVVRKPISSVVSLDIIYSNERITSLLLTLFQTEQTQIRQEQESAL